MGFSLRGVEQRDALQIVEHIRAERRIDGDLFGEPRVHFFLDERGVEVAGVEDDQSGFFHGFCSMEAQTGRDNQPGQGGGATSHGTFHSASRAPMALELRDRIH